MPRLLVVLVPVLLASDSAIAAGQQSRPPETPAVPLVTFAVTPLLDGPCTRLTSQPPDSAAAAELRARLGEFRTLWDREGAPLLDATVALTGQPFRFRETIAAMHVCSGLSNMSLPLLLAMRRYLRTAPAGEWADSLAIFSAVTFHEILHRHVVDLLGSQPSTPLWKKYAGETPTVRWHLHLMAIEEAVFRRLGREREFASVRAHNQRWPSYKRAREIVDAEGAEAFLAELRARP